MVTLREINQIPGNATTQFFRLLNATEQIATYLVTG